MLIKTKYPNLLHGCDCLCFNLMNYWFNSKFPYLPLTVNKFVYLKLLSGTPTSSLSLSLSSSSSLSHGNEFVLLEQMPN